MSRRGARLVWPELSDISFSISSWFPYRWASSCLTAWLHIPIAADVLTPEDFELPYVALDLKTEDDITLRCYLLVQKKKLGLNARHASLPSDMTEEEVRI